jgi:hypothetical protein
MLRPSPGGTKDAAAALKGVITLYELAYLLNKGAKFSVVVGKKQEKRQHYALLRQQDLRS